MDALLANNPLLSIVNAMWGGEYARVLVEAHVRMIANMAEASRATLVLGRRHPCSEATSHWRVTL